MKARTHYHSGLRRQNMENISRGRATGAALRGGRDASFREADADDSGEAVREDSGLALGRIRRNADGVPEPAGERVAATRVQTSGCSRWHRAIRPAARRETRRNYCRDGNALHGFIRKLLARMRRSCSQKSSRESCLRAARNASRTISMRSGLTRPNRSTVQTGRRWPARCA